jgi:hypothetical protein
LRLVVPGRWGYKWIHHLNKIELVNYDFLGKFESQGYSDSAEIFQSGTPSDTFKNLPEATTLNRNGSSSITPKYPPNSPPLPSPSPSAIQNPYPTPNPQPEGGITGTPTRLGLAEEIIYIAATVSAVSVVSVCLIFYFVKFRKQNAEK